MYKIAKLCPYYYKVGGYMKKWILYIIISILFLISIGSIILLITMYKDTKNTEMDSMDKFDEIDNNSITNDTQIVTTSYSSTKISPNAILNFNTYYKECGHTVKEEKNAGEDVINKSEQEISEKYVDWDIKKFSENNVVLYKEVDGVCDEDYIIREKDGNIVIFKLDNKGREILYDTTSIESQYLPETDLIQLKDGIKVNGLEKLNQIIEDFE